MPYLSFLFHPIIFEYLMCSFSDNKMICNLGVQLQENFGPSEDPG